MTFGLHAFGPSGAEIISTDRRPLVYHERGFTTIASNYTDRPGYATVVFDSVVTTQAPPHVFVRYVSGRHASLTTYFTFHGEPGAWTGFLITSGVLGGRYLQAHEVEYVVSKFAQERASASYGLEIFDPEGGILFSSDDRVVTYSKFTKEWRMLSILYDHTTYESDLTIEEDDFIDITSLNQGIMYFGHDMHYAGIYLWRNSGRVLQLDCQHVSGRTQYIAPGDLYYCIPVCKFPISRYP